MPKSNVILSTVSKGNKYLFEIASGLRYPVFKEEVLSQSYMYHINL